MKKSAVMTKLAALAVLLACIAAPGFSDDKTEKVDKLFAPWSKTTSPGAALAIIKDGRVIFKHGYGMAKIEDGIVMTPDKVFDIGSVSKQFTATCVVLLLRQGKLGLDDPVRKYLPELPDYGKPITIRHLLHHTSGLRDYNALLDLAGFRPDSDCPNVDEALEIIARQKKLNSPPGEEFSYTNTGYFLLSQIVERVSGQSLNVFAQKNIFRPLGMTSTLYQDDHTQIIRNRASGYAPSEKGFKLDMSNWDETGDGNVYTTVEDLCLWDKALTEGKLGRDVAAQLLTTGTLNNGKKITYAFGLVVSEYKGLKIVEHGGAWAGFRAAIVRFPDQRFSVICLANLGTINPSNLALRVADIYLADKLKEPAKPEEKKAEGQAKTEEKKTEGATKPEDKKAEAPAKPEEKKTEGPAKPEEKKAEKPALTPENLEAYVGTFQDGKFGLWLDVSLKESRLMAAFAGRKLALAPLGPSSFNVPASPTPIGIEFIAGGKNLPIKARVQIGADQEFLFEKTAPPRMLTPALIREYAGIFVSRELLDARYEIAVEKDGLVLNTRNMRKVPLQAKAPDKFVAGDIGMNLEFVRGPGSKVTGFKLGVGRAGGIEFLRK